MSISKFMRVAGVCLVAVFAVSLVASGTASAVPTWKQCIENSGTGTKWETAKCSKINATTNKYEWVEVTNTEKVESSGKLKLADTNVPVVGEVEAVCTGYDKGVIGPGRYGRVQEIKVSTSNCTPGTNCEKVEKVEARNLPWQTELLEESSQTRNKITETTGKQPGWVVSCRVLLITKEDECLTETGNEGTTAIENQQSTGDVIATFDEKTKNAKCSIGGAATGRVRGSVYNWAEGGTYAIKVS